MAGPNKSPGIPSTYSPFDIHGLTLSPPPRLSDPANLRTIPLEPDAIGRTLHGGRSRQEWLANIDRRVSQVERRHSLPRHIAHAPPTSMGRSHAVRIHAVPQARRGTPSATTGRRHQAPSPSLSLGYATDRTGQRRPQLVQEFQNRDAFRAALRRGDIAHGARVAFPDAQGRRVEAQVAINYQTRKAHLISIR